MCSYFSKAGELPYTVDASRKDVSPFTCCCGLAELRCLKKAPCIPVPQVAEDRYNGKQEPPVLPEALLGSCGKGEMPSRPQQAQGKL